MCSGLFCFQPFVKKLCKHKFFIIACNDSNALNSGNFIAFELCIAACHDNDGIWKTSCKRAYLLAAFFVCLRCDTTSINHYDVRCFTCLNTSYAFFCKKFCNGGRFGKVQFAPEGMKQSRMVSKCIFIYHYFYRRTTIISTEAPVWLFSSDSDLTNAL